MRTGPLGRLARLVLLAVAVESLVSIADQGGPSSFRGAKNLLEPSLLVLDAVMVILFVALIGILVTALRGTRSAGRWQVGAFIGLGAAVAIAAAASQIWHGSVWDRPLSDLVWWFDTLMLLELIVALLVAIAVGMPGCELGVWPLLISRARGERTPMQPFGCIVGLHFIDQWESSRRGTNP